MIATAIAVIKALWGAGWLQAIGSALIGWLLPSPAEMRRRKLAAIKAAEDKASATGDVTDLDHLP